MSSAEILTFREAVNRLPMRNAVARRWLRDSRLVSTVEGRELVIWSDVVEALRAVRQDVTPAPAPKPRRAPERRRAAL